MRGSPARTGPPCQPGTGHREMQIRACRELGGFEPDLRYASDDFLILLELVRAHRRARACCPTSCSTTGTRRRRPLVADGTIGREVFLLTRARRTPAVDAVAAALRDAV